MTIVATVKARDGLVLAADSMTTVTVPTDDGPQFVKAFENGHKLFHMRDLPIGTVTYGLGNIGGRSMEGLVRDACQQMPGEVRQVGDVATSLYGYLRDAYEAQFEGLELEQKPECGFIVGGYSPDEPFAQLFEFGFPNGSGAVEIGEPGVCGATWRGVDFPFVRLWRGFAPAMLQELLEKDGLSQERVDELIAPLEIGVAYDGMPVQDAVNFATYILDTTIGFSRFAHGVPACGGPLQVAAILPGDGFQWIARPELRIAARP
jgi:hypothetical protein